MSNLVKKQERKSLPSWSISDEEYRKKAEELNRREKNDSEQAKRNIQWMRDAEQVPEEIISMEFIVGEEDLIREKIDTTSLPKINEIQFMNSLDTNGKKVFEKIFSFGKNNSLICKWGSKGFSLNVGINNENVTLLFGYPPKSVFKQSIYTGYEMITKKVNNSEGVVDFYKAQIKSFGYFQDAGSISKWIIDKSYSEKEINKFLNISRLLKRCNLIG